MYALFLIFGFQIGYAFHKVRQEIRSLANSLRKEPSPSVVSTDSEVARIRQREESSFIAEPKSPQLIEFEETEELRKMNPGKF